MSNKVRHRAVDCLDRCHKARGRPSGEGNTAKHSTAHLHRAAVQTKHVFKSLQPR